MHLGAIADDVTGGTDLAGLLRRAGLDVVQTFDAPDRVPRADAVVVSLKIRTASVQAASAAAATACTALASAGAEQIYFKYCSTFDSTDEGNIGPVIDTLLETLGADFTIACPSYPEVARTVYLGHLFVGKVLLSESSMRYHPLTPMADSNLVRVLGRQTSSRVGLVDLSTIDAGPRAVCDRFDELRRSGHRIAICDAIFDRHLETIAEASRGVRLLTGGAALGGVIARQARRERSAGPRERGFDVTRPVAMLSGSCSAATLAQLQHARTLVPALEIDPMKVAEDPAELERIFERATDALTQGSVLIYSSGEPAAVKDVQERLGRSHAAALIETAFGKLATRLADAGVRTFVVAGGETSAAVLHALRIRMLTFGDELDPGVPWTLSMDPEGFVFALKSGNFGSREFFTKALDVAA